MPSAKVLSITVVLMAGEWILLVAGTRLHEMIVGALSIAACAAFLHMAGRSDTQRLDFRAADVLTFWRIPGYVVGDVYRITIVLFRDLFGIERAGSFYRVCGFKTGKRDPRLVALRVLATAYTTATPSIIVIGIDLSQSRMLFHQVYQSPVPKMTRSLGAQP